MVSIVPMFLFVIIRLSKLKKDLTQKNSDKHATGSAMIGEVFGNVRVVKAFVKEKYELQKYSENLDQILGQSFKNSTL